MDKTIKQDDAVFKLLDLKTINRVICQTDKGTLSLQIRKGESNYHLILDAVPLESDVNKELMGILFPVKQAEVPQVKKDSFPNEKEKLINTPGQIAKGLKLSKKVNTDNATFRDIGNGKVEVFDGKKTKIAKNVNEAHKAILDD